MTPRLLRRPAPPSPNITESEFQSLIVDLARWLGYQTYHTYDSRRSEEGWPDLAIVGYGRLFLWELKSARGRLSAPQLDWGEALLAAGQRYRVVRPADWESIVAELEQGAVADLTAEE